MLRDSSIVGTVAAWRLAARKRATVMRIQGLYRRRTHHDDCVPRQTAPALHFDQSFEMREQFVFTRRQSAPQHRERLFVPQKIHPRVDRAAAGARNEENIA